MKSIQKAILERNATVLQRMMPPEPEHGPGEYDAVDLFNELLRQIRAAMPAAMQTIKTQEDLDEIRRQWTMALKENGIRTIAQVEAGMAIARKQENPFLPSPGQFVAWCKQGSLKAAGLPTEDELVELVLKFGAERAAYSSLESYPWQSNPEYWMVTTLYSDMRSGNQSRAELRREARIQLSKMSKRLESGETIPPPTARLPQKRRPPLSKEHGLNKIAEIRARFGFNGGKSNG